MAPISFLDLPFTVREQIYAELLVSSPVQHDQYSFRPSEVSTSILYTNKQISAESVDTFYAKNLFIIVQSDCSTFNLLSLKPPTALRFLPSRSVDNIHQNPSRTRFAMTLELLSIGGRHSEQNLSSAGPTFVIPAQALRHLMADLAAALRASAQVSVAQVQIHNTFRYSVPRFSKLVFGGLISMQRLPTLKALSIRGPLDSDYHRRLMTKLLHNQDRIWFDYAGLFASCRSRIQCHMHPQCADTDVMVRSNIAELRSLLRTLDIVWDFHAFLGFQHNELYVQASLFQSVADLYGTLVLAHLIEAKRHPDRAIFSYLNARLVAEEGIAYLNSEHRMVDRSNFETFPSYVIRENMTLTGRAKAMLSLKASKACTKLGDRAAAAQYITDAHKNDANMSPTSQELRLRLEWKKLPEPHELPDECKGPPRLWRPRT